MLRCSRGGPARSRAVRKGGVGHRIATLTVRHAERRPRPRKRRAPRGHPEAQSARLVVVGRRHDVPVSPIHPRGFVSIGCEPCTRAIAEGEDPRAGRFYWEPAEHKECHPHGRPYGRTATVNSAARSPG